MDDYTNWMLRLAEAVGIDMDSPEYQEAKAIMKAKYANAETRYCKNGCANLYEPGASEPFSGSGVAGCTEPECQ